MFEEVFYLVGFIISLLAMLILIIVIARQPAVEKELAFKVYHILKYVFELKITPKLIITFLGSICTIRSMR